MKHNLTFEDLEGALMFVSCDTTELDDENEKYHRDFPFTFRDGQLLCFEVSPDDVDTDFNMSQYDEVLRGKYNLENYSDLKAFANAVLNSEGKEYVKALYYDEELVVDNKFTFTLFNAEREVVFTYSKIVDVEIPKPVDSEDEKEEPFEQAMSASLRQTLDMDDEKFRSDRRVVLLHLFIFVAVAVLVWWMGDSAGWSKLGKWMVSITSGLYFTQLLWCNIPHEHLGVIEKETRRAKGRPWINGGFIVGLLLIIINVVYYVYNPPLESFAYYYMLWWMLTFMLTFVWGFLTICHRYLNRSALDEMKDALGGSIERNMRRIGLKRFLRGFFLGMLPVGWEIKIRNKRIERLDREEREGR